MAKKSNGRSNRGALQLYRGYNFVNKDPAIDKIRTIIQDEGVSEAQMHVLSGVSSTTFANWFRGDTKRPQFCTLAAAAAAIGYDWELQKKKVVNVETELPKAQAWLDKQRRKQE